MNLLVLGATGATGALLIEQAVAAGNNVTALVRSPDKVSTKHSDLKIISGQATKVADVTSAMAGADAVISTLGAPKGTVMTDAVRAMVAACEAHDVRRIVMLSTFALERDRLTAFTKVLSGITMRSALKDRSIAEEILRSSDRDWIIAHAARLTNKAASGKPEELPSGAHISMSQTISRADLAGWLLEAATSASQGVRREVLLVG
jgi:uncharacterized protein YbjT (DUF2867 family)